MGLSIILKACPNFSGGANRPSFNELIYSKLSILRMTNEGNECFWWAIVLLLNYNSSIYDKLKDL
jgi:hypothetical protein